MDKPVTPAKQLDMSHYFLFFLIIVSLAFCYRMLHPYLDPIIFAILLSVMTSPLYERLRRLCKGRKNMAALLSCCVLTLVVIIPFTLIVSQIIKQGIGSFNAINEWIRAGNLSKLEEVPLISNAVDLGRQYLDHTAFKELDFQSIIMKTSSFAGEFLVNKGGYLITNVTAVAGKFFLMVFTYFFAVQGQKQFFARLSHLTPLTTSHEDILVSRIHSVAKSALLGTVVTAVAQGVAGGVAFTICGLPGIFWGAVMAFASLIPVVGTALIWVPAAGYLMIAGSYKSAIFLIIWSAVVVGSIDNFVRPLFMSGSAEMGTLFIFFSILGGISFFGLTGLLYGPLILGITLVLLSIYELEFQQFLNTQDNR